MTLSSRWRRAAAVMVAAATVVPFAATANAAPPVRTADTTKYKRSDFLQRALGVPANTVIESVTYDRFQNLLRHTGNYAILIGDPATDATFAARAVAVDAAARAAAIQKVYWFNPNLTGGAKIGTGTIPNLDIRNSGAIKLVENSRNKYRDAWQNLVAQSLGNGVTATASNPGAQSQSVSTVTGQAGAAVNDSVDPIYDYSATPTPANLTDSYFLVYNTDATSGAAKDKVVSWVNLTDDAAAATKVAAAIAGKQFARVEQFAWWQEEANERQRVGTQNTASQNPEVPVLTDADNVAADGGWRVNQVTLPELADLLDHASDSEAVILFGGTWCPNTRAVLPFVNKEAQKNNVTVYNFDTVLDGGKVGGNPTGGANPLQTRNGHGNADGDGNRTFPSYVYGELVNQYIGNFITEYQPTETNAITYFPFGDTSQAAKSKARLQVPYLFGYKGKGSTTTPNDGVTRQWIQKGSTVTTPVVRTHTEYMSNWYYTNPLPNRVNIPFPAAVPAWQKVNAAIAGFTYQTDVSTIIPSRAVYTDTAEYLTTETATVGKNAQGRVTVSSGGPTDISQPALTAALAALGASAPKTLTEAQTAWLANEADTNLRTVVGAWTTVDTRKGNIATAFGSPTTPNSIAGGAAAKRALEVLFNELPTEPVVEAPPVATPIPTPIANPGPPPGPPIKVKAKASKVAGAVATAPTSKKAGKYKLTISTPKGSAKASGKVTLKLKKGKVTKTVKGTLKNGVVTVKVPKLARGTWKVSVSWAGDANYQARSFSGASIKVRK